MRTKGIKTEPKSQMTASRKLLRGVSPEGLEAVEVMDEFNQAERACMRDAIFEIAIACRKAASGTAEEEAPDLADDASPTPALTAESTEIAAMVDRFPDNIRPRLRDALLRIAEIYVLSGTKIAPVRREKTQDADVIQLSNYFRPEARQ